MTNNFIDREEELEKLIALHKQSTPSLVVMRGRRRIGKSRLIAEFAARRGKQNFWSFAGIPPQGGMSVQNQRDNFANQMVALFKIPPLTFQDWSDAFKHLSLHVNEGDIILFDEVSWMAADDPTFIPKFKDWWDRQSARIIVVLCGSVSTWIEDNILNSTALFGRISLTMTLGPLSVSSSASLIRETGFQGSDYDICKLLNIFGGVPWYLERASYGQTADHIIKQLCFVKDGLLVLEFDRIFHDLFNGKGSVYKRILAALKDGMKTLSEVRAAIDFAHSGTLSQLMEHLIVAGFVTRQKLWAFKTQEKLKQSLYRICDPYMRFYLKVIEPLRDKIDSGDFNDVDTSNIPGFDVHMRFQLEYLLLQDRPLLLKSVGISPMAVACAGPYRQSKTLEKPGCQIDYLVQTVTNNLFVYEFKFQRKELGPEVIDEMKNKIASLKIPKGYSCIPVLFHIGGVAASVEMAGYFYRIVDITEFLKK